MGLCCSRCVGRPLRAGDPSALDRPPGGASTREVGRSVSTFPQFWFLPFANALLLPEMPVARAPWFAGFATCGLASGTCGSV